VDLLMRYLFWVVLVVIVAAGCGAYYLLLPPVDQYNGLKSEVEKKSRDLLAKAAKANEIPTERHVAAVKQYGDALKQQETEVKDLLRQKRSSMDAKFEKAPASPLDFDAWLINVRKEILDEATKAGMALPSEFAIKWLDEGKTTTTQADRDARLKKVALAAEVVHTLAQAHGPLTVTKFTGEADKPEVSEETQAGVASLDYLELVPAEKVALRDRDALQLAFASSGAALSMPKSIPAEDSTATCLDIRFTAPLSVVAVVVQALEADRSWFGVVRKIDTQRVAEPYVKATDISLIAPGAPAEEASKRPPTNTHFREAPIQTQVWLDLLTVKPEMLKSETVK
jgi:hypothetical protein